MPIRKTPLVNGEIYHLINRGVASQPIFLTKRDFERCLLTMFYYQNPIQAVSYSHLIRFPRQKNKIEAPPVEILTYCLMPNHFHLLVKQIQENGITTFIRKLTNSYSKFFNTKNKRKGPLFEGRFRAVLIETNEQLLHVNRYIHLNPYSSYLVKTKNQLLSYPFSSLPEYLNPQALPKCTKEIILSQFKNISSYKEFLLDQADYQQTLDQIKHLSLD